MGKKLLALLIAVMMFTVTMPVLEVHAEVPDVNVSYTDVTDSSVDLSWDAVEDVSQYQVWLNGNCVAWGIGDTFYRMTALPGNTVCNVSIVALASTSDKGEDGELGRGSCTFTTLAGPSDNPDPDESESTDPAPEEPGSIDAAPDESGSTDPAPEEPGGIGGSQADEIVMNVSAADVNATSADIKWDQVEGAAFYELFFDENRSELFDTSTLSYTMSELSPDTSYAVKVAAYDSADAVIAEGTVEFTTAEAQKPAKVKKFRTVSSYKSVILKWKKSSGVDGYKMYWTGKNGKKGVIKKNAKATKHTFKITDTNREVKYTFKIVAVKDGLESDPVTKKDSAVQLMKLQITLKVNKDLKNHDKPEGKYQIHLKAGTKIKTIGFTNGKYVFQKKVKGKLRTFHVMRIATRNQKVNYIGASTKSKGWRIVKPKIAYTKEEAESFINTLGVKSNTKYLIWVNQYSQRLYIFKSSSKGKKKDWKLIKNCYKDEDDGYPGWPVASGKPSSPTSTGKTSIKQRDLGGGGKVPFWNVTTWFSIHGNSPGPWGPLGWPKSGACCRNTTPHAKWIYYNTPMRTSVYVY